MNKNDFSDPLYIGMRYGNLTILEHIGNTFKVRCDCGFEKQVKCSAVNNGKTVSCGRHECEYHKMAMNYYGKYGEIVREVGIKTEQEVFSYLLSLGYKVEQTPISSDYGVDIICIGRKGERVAIQIKNNQKTKSKTSVQAVMEVFAGSKYYDCDKCAVVSYTGYTENARKMADKLGVLLCNEKCELYDFSAELPINTKYIWVVNGKEEPMMKTFREHGWDGSHLKRFVGMTYEEVKKFFINTEVRKERLIKIKEKGLSKQYIDYRMNVMGMTFEEAINAPKVQMGRPRKQGVAI